MSQDDNSGRDEGPERCHEQLLERYADSSDITPTPEPLAYVKRGTALSRILAARAREGMDMPDLTLTPAERDALQQRLSVITHINTTKGLEPTDSILAELGLHGAIGRSTRARYAATDKLASDIRHQLYGDKTDRDTVPASLKLAPLVLVGGAAFLMVNVLTGIALMVAGVVVGIVGILAMIHRPPRDTAISYADLVDGIGFVVPDAATADLARRVSELPWRYTGIDAHDSIAEWSRRAQMALGDLARDRSAVDLSTNADGDGDEDSDRSQLCAALDEQLANIERDYHDRAGALSKTHLDLARMNHPGLSTPPSTAAQH